MEGKLGTVLAQERTLEVLPSLAGLFPEGGLRRGSTVTVGPGAFPGATSLALSLLAGPSAGGSWCAVVGAPDLGLVAAAQVGAELERLAMVPSPGAHWPVVTAALLEGFDIVLLRPPGPVSRSDARKLEARARERGSVLAILSGHWPGAADIRLSVSGGSWRGLEQGCGHLSGAEVEVTAEGRGASSRPRRARTWLGGPVPAPVATSLAGPEAHILMVLPAVPGPSGLPHSTAERAG
jgi:hypothetical protein